MNSDKILDKLGLKYEDLNVAEKQTFNEMLESLSKSKMTPEKLREYITQLRTAVENELIKEPEHVRVGIFTFRNDNNIFLKARLRNYMLIESFLQTPEKAKEALERALAGMVQTKEVTKV